MSFFIAGAFFETPLTDSAIIVTTSSRKDRLEGYLGVGDIHLTHDDVKAIDHAGAKGELWEERKNRAWTVGKFIVRAAVTGYIGTIGASYLRSIL